VSRFKSVAKVATETLLGELRIPGAAMALEGLSTYQVTPG